VFRRLYPDQPFQLVMIGSCRGDEDAARLDFLRAETRRRHLEDSVEFVVNQPYSVLEEWLQKASIGIHTVRHSHGKSEYAVASLSYNSCGFVRCGTNILGSGLSK
jgi:alpha-1,2-mannosyltransferase